jgi:uncharacterized membrane protein YedE/YeeE
MRDAWLHALLGGVLIGTAATLMLWLNGRITGISGIFFDAISGSKESLWRWAFLLGLVSGGAIAAICAKVSVTAPTSAPSWTIPAAGLLVGFGVRLGMGCTSGPGVCGVARLAPRSLLATACFMATGILSVFVFRSIGVIR